MKIKIWRSCVSNKNVCFGGVTVITHCADELFAFVLRINNLLALLENTVRSFV